MSQATLNLKMDGAEEAILQDTIVNNNLELSEFLTPL